MGAMTDAQKMVLQIDANVELLQQSLRAGEREVERFKRSTEKNMSTLDRAFAKVGNGLAPLKAGLAGLAGGIAAIGVGGAARSFLAIADQSKQMTSQLKLATGQFGSYSQAQKDAERIATTTRNGLSETVTLYGNFLRASQPLGKSQADAARATETFSKALKIGGAGAAEAASATLQFGQALASGVLRGDEFNSIAEASPRILRLLADSLGVSAGALRGMAAEGKLTADVLYKALTDRKFTESIDQEFTQLPKTFDESMTLVHNAAIIAFGAFDRGGQFSTALANFVGDGADGFKSLAKDAEESGREIRGIFDGLSSAWAPFLGAGQEAMRLIGLEGKSTAELIGDYIGFQLSNMQKLANFPLGGAFGFKPFTFGDDYNEERRLSVSRAHGRAVGEEHLRKRGEFYKAIGGVPDSSRADFLGLYDLGIEKRPGATPSAGSKGKAKSAGAGRAAAKKKTDADLSPMDLILRDIGKERLPLGIEFTGEKELDGARNQIAELETGLAKIDEFTKTVNIGDVLKADEMERLQRFTDAFTEDLSRGLADAIVYGDSLGDVLVNTFKRAAAELIASNLMNMLNGGAGGAGGAGGGLGAAFASVGKLFGFADGGEVKRFAGGGPISGPGTGRSDSIIAAVSNGEYIVNARATAQHRGLLEALNSGQLPRFANGGLVAPRVPNARALASAGGSRTSVQQSFDMRGAMVDKDVYADIHRISSGYAQRAHIGAVQESQSEMVRRSARKLGR